MSGRPGARGAVRSSLPYQLLLYCNGWYFALYFAAELLLFIYKRNILPYPGRSLVAEFFLFLLLCCTEALRNFAGRKGNLTENSGSVGVSLVLSVPVLVALFYFVIWQTYVLRIEVILIAIQIVFVLLQIIFGIVAVATFARAAPL